MRSLAVYTDEMDDLQTGIQELKDQLADFVLAKKLHGNSFCASRY